jgi:hypothetical protein
VGDKFAKAAIMALMFVVLVFGVTGRIVDCVVDTGALDEVDNKALLLVVVGPVNMMEGTRGSGRRGSSFSTVVSPLL